MLYFCKLVFFGWLSCGCTTCASLLVEDSSLERRSVKTPFHVVLDTTCSDCQNWVAGQFRPLWVDDNFRQEVIQPNFELKFLAHSVTRHQQGPLLNSILNCAHRQLDFNVFLEALFCWEGNVQAWVPLPGSKYFKEQQLNITNLMVMCMPEDSLSSLATCAAGYTSDIDAFSLPADFIEVPWIVIGKETYSMAQNDSGVYKLKEVLEAKVAPTGPTQRTGVESIQPDLQT